MVEMRKGLRRRFGTNFARQELNNTVGIVIQLLEALVHISILRDNLTFVFTPQDERRVFPVGFLLFRPSFLLLVVFRGGSDVIRVARRLGGGSVRRGVFHVNRD